MLDFKSENLSKEITEKYSVSRNTLFSTPRNKVEELLELEIGDSKEDVFYPQLKIKNWDNETNLSVRLKDEDENPAEIISEGNKIKWKKQNIEAHYYDIPKIKEEVKKENVDYSSIDLISYGGISAEELPAIHKFPYGETKPVLSSYYINEDGFGFFGKRYASSDLKDIKNKEIPFARFPTERKTGCTVHPVVKDSAMVLDLYYPNAKEKNEELLTIYENSIKEVFKNYGIDIIRRDEELFEHVLFYEDDGVLKQIVRMTWDNNNIICIIHLDNPFVERIISKLKAKVLFQDNVLFPTIGLRDIDENIDLSILDELRDEVAKKLKATPIKKSISKSNSRIETLKKKYNTVKFLEEADEEDGINRDEAVDAYEFDVVLKEKPVSNVLEFTIETKGLDFFYQPELTAEEKAKGERRKPYVVGSYAVYHKEKKGDYTDLGGNNYKAGKAFHIYRPKITDADGNWVWGELNIDTESKILKVITPQEFLDKAVYPINIDPTFGYTTAGSSEAQVDGLGSKETCTESGLATKISFIGDGDGKQVTGKGAIFEENGSNVDLITNGDTGDTVSYQNNYERDPFDLEFTTSPTLVAQDYIVVISTEGEPMFYYDSGTKDSYEDTLVDKDDHDDFPQNSYTPGAVTTNKKYSVYVTYTETATGTDTNSERSAKVTGKPFSERDSKVTGKDISNSERNCKLTGGLLSNSERSAKVTGKQTSNSERNSELTGKDIENSERSAKTLGKDDTSNERQLKTIGTENAQDELQGQVTGQDNLDTSRQGKVVGELSTGSDRASKVTGEIAISDERDSKLIGKINDTSERFAKSIGTLDDNSERQAKLKGELGFGEDRAGKLTGEETAQSEKNAKLIGGINEVSEKQAKITGKQQVNSERLSKLAGTDTDNSERQSKVIGTKNIPPLTWSEIDEVWNDINQTWEEYAPYEKNAKVVGKALGESERACKVVGIQNDEESERQAKVIGTEESSSERQSKVVGELDITTEKDSKVVGTLDDESERQSKLVGQVFSESERKGKLHGTDDLESEKQGKVVGKEIANSEKQAKLIGEIEDNSERNLKLIGKVETNSERLCKLTGVDILSRAGETDRLFVSITKQKLNVLIEKEELVVSINKQKLKVFITKQR